MEEKAVPGEFVHVMESEDAKAAESFDTSTTNEFNDAQLENRPVCPTCKQSFATIFTLRAHLRYKHKEKLDEVKRIPCMEEGCDYYTRIIDDLVNHLRTKHQKPIDTQHLTFKSQQEFATWKAKEEKRSHSLFTTVSGAHKLVNGLERTYFLCNRSGFYKPKGHAGRRAKATGSRKMNAYCTAKIALTVRKNEASVPVEWDIHYTATHYGHDVDVEHLNLTKAERDTIASLLRQGLSVIGVLKRIRELSRTEGSERLALVNKQDVRNVAIRYAIPFRMREADETGAPGSGGEFEFADEDDDEAGGDLDMDYAYGEAGYADQYGVAGTSGIQQYDENGATIEYSADDLRGMIFAELDYARSLTDTCLDAETLYAALADLRGVTARLRGEYVTMTSLTQAEATQFGEAEGDAEVEDDGGLVEESADAALAEVDPDAQFEATVKVEKVSVRRRVRSNVRTNIIDANAEVEADESDAQFVVTSSAHSHFAEATSPGGDRSAADDGPGKKRMRIITVKPGQSRVDAAGDNVPVAALDVEVSSGASAQRAIRGAPKK